VDEDRRPVEDGRSNVLNPSDDAAMSSAQVDSERLPRGVRRSLDRCAEQWVQRCAATTPGSSPDAGPVPIVLHRSTPWLAWTIAAAALLLAVVGWWPRLVEPSTESSVTDFGQWRAHLARERLLSSSADVGHWRLAQGVGDVVWDRQRQRGYLLLRGFVANDPSRARYQLWIFDGARDERYPVHGGVFDVPPGRAEVVIPVKAALPVARPTAFAVTVERPDGAVVSLREKLVAFVQTES
jgi:hypothetical protein